MPLSFQDPFFNNSLQRTPALVLAKENMFRRNGHHFQDDGQEEFCMPCEPIRSFLEIETSYNHQNVCKVDYGNVITDIAEKGFASRDKEDICEHSGEEEEVNGVNMISEDKYIVPPSLIERWGSAMGIL